jgi:hypothetical protein
MLRERPNIFGQIKTSTLGFNLGFEGTPLGQQEWTIGLGTTKMRREDCRNYLVNVSSLPTRLHLKQGTWFGMTRSFIHFICRALAADSVQPGGVYLLANS